MSTLDTTKVYQPLPPPDNLFTENPRAELAGLEREKYDTVSKHFTALHYQLPGFETHDSGVADTNEMNGKEVRIEGERRTWTSELIEEEKFWLSYECILRYLRASKWKPRIAIQRLEDTLKWRREYGLYDFLTTDFVSIEGETGKIVVFGFDTKGRPVLYMIPSRQNTEESPRQLQYTVWMLERCIDLMPRGTENIAILIDYASKAKSPSMNMTRAFLNTFQDHYPERMGAALLINIPFLMNAFLKLAMPFVDPVTREKIRLNPSPIEDGLVSGDQLMKEGWGGNADFKYDHAQFFSALVKMSCGRRECWIAEWKKLGGTIGIKEWDYKMD